MATWCQSYIGTPEETKLENLGNSQPGQGGSQENVGGEYVCDWNCLLKRLAQVKGSEVLTGKTMRERSRRHFRALSCPPCLPGPAICPVLATAQRSTRCRWPVVEQVILLLQVCIMQGVGIVLPRGFQRITREAVPEGWGHQTPPPQELAHLSQSAQQSGGGAGGEGRSESVKVCSLPC